MVKNSDWMEYAACKGMDSSVFFPDERPSKKSLKRIERAKEVCGACAVKDACGLHAKTNKEGVGIWGGLTATERSRGCF